MKRAIQGVTLLLALVTLLTACGSVPSQLSTIADSTPLAYFDSSNNSGYLYQSSKPTYSTREEVLNVVFHEPLVEQAELEIHYKKERKTLIEDILKVDRDKLRGIHAGRDQLLLDQLQHDRFPAAANPGHDLNQICPNKRTNPTHI